MILLILWLYVIINLLFIGAGLNAELLPKGFSPREKLSAKRTDEGRTFRGSPFPGNHGNAAPHPSAVGGPQTPSPKKRTVPDPGRRVLYTIYRLIS